jgi:FkbM family methyltransferase
MSDDLSVDAVETQIRRLIDNGSTAEDHRASTRVALVEGASVAVYGGGSFARSLVRELITRGVVVRCVLDERANELREIEGIPVFPPGSEPIPFDDRQVIPVLIAVFNRDASLRSIADSLRIAGYTQILAAPALYELLAGSLGERFWLARRDFYKDRLEQIVSVAKRWSDEKSREVYLSLLRFRLGQISAEPIPAASIQYFPTDVPGWTGMTSFVDCGAYNGDTMAAAAASGVELTDVYAFEPDPANFAQLTRFARQFQVASAARITLWPCAVGDRFGFVRFVAESGEGSRLSSTGGAVVPVVPLDDVLLGADITHVKMDIEGAETRALCGASDTIRRCRPGLAICVYHRPADLWEIPLLVASLGVDYALHLRSHGCSGFETVLYAVPA